MTKHNHPSFADAAVEVLRERGPLHYRDLATLVLREGRVTLNSQRPAQTLTAALVRRDDVERVAPGIYRVKEAP
jgi:HB1, ASXL, restriction endonuclease HTH domain